MKIFRVLCKFESGYRHLSGSDKKCWHFSRGAWRVVDSQNVTSVTNPESIKIRQGLLGVLAVRKPRNGTRVDPRKLLQEYLDARGDAFGPFGNFLARSYA